MPADEPRWWYGRQWPVMARALQPLATLYGLAVRWRYMRTRPYRPRIPVVCVGNLVAGGTGKTPVALHIARLLQAAGHKPGFLSRGYGGRFEGPHLVATSHDTAADVGDEPLLLARVAPTVVARDRAAGARHLEQAGVSHIVMDDGLQNPTIAKDLSLAVVDGARGIGNGRVIPAGPLRADLRFQARLVDALVVTAVEPTLLELPDELAKRVYCPVVSARRVADGSIEAFRRGQWTAFAGIGNPDGFFDMLEREGITLANELPFMDHQPYTENDAEAILALAFAADSGVLTTAKDWVRIPPRGGALGRLKKEARVVELRLEFDEADKARLDGLLHALKPPL